MNINSPLNQTVNTANAAFLKIVDLHQQLIMIKFMYLGRIDGGRLKYPEL